MNHYSFLGQLLSISDVKVPATKNPFDCSYDAKLDSLVPLCDFEPTDDHARNELLVPTSNLLVTYQIIQPWLVNKEHVLLIGPEASGKRYTIYLLLLNC